jgi:hypothetical protein
MLIGSICAGRPEYSETLMKYDIIDHIIMSWKGYPHSSPIKKEFLWTLSNLAVSAEFITKYMKDHLELI